MTTQPELISVLTCPSCGHAKVETMPTDACQWFYDCEGCGAVLRKVCKTSLPLNWQTA